MATIYRKPIGVRTRGRDRLNYVAAHHVVTAAMLTQEATPIYLRAKAILAAHRDTGTSSIEHTVGDVDHYISIVDPQGDAPYIEHTVSPLRKSVRG